ncbi:MAG TPA: hypothetical protein VK737_11210 [Opitutales bacterium]|jgi:hypothetical protein|nr:hypothetical protein [Opitutales bacterium]
MKNHRLLSLLLLFTLCGCVSTNLENYQYITTAQLNAKIKANGNSEPDMFNSWRYAGSDDKYDYIYEYKPGISVSPNTNFHYYKLDKGQVKIDNRYPFAPDAKGNMPLPTEW